MKGIIFREFLDHVEHIHGDAVVNTIINASKLESNGAYTSVGTYPYTDMIKLLTNLSEQLKIEIPDLLIDFGKYLFQRFAELYPNMFDTAQNAFSFLSEIEKNIHIQVLKLYPQAQVPNIQAQIKDNTMILMYSSDRKLSDLAEGLILGCLDHFSETAKIDKKILNSDASKVRFIITKIDG